MDHCRLAEAWLIQRLQETTGAERKDVEEDVSRFMAYKTRTDDALRYQMVKVIAKVNAIERRAMEENGEGGEGGGSLFWTGVQEHGASSTRIIAPTGLSSSASSSTSSYSLFSDKPHPFFLPLDARLLLAPPLPTAPFATETDTTSDEGLAKKARKKAKLKRKKARKRSEAAERHRLGTRTQHRHGANAQWTIMTHAKWTVLVDPAQPPRATDEPIDSSLLWGPGYGFALRGGWWCISATPYTRMQADLRVLLRSLGEDLASVLLAFGAGCVYVHGLVKKKEWAAIRVYFMGVWRAVRVCMGYLPVDLCGVFGGEWE